MYSSNELRHELVSLNVPCHQGKREEAGNSERRAGQTVPLHLDISRTQLQLLIEMFLIDNLVILPLVRVSGITAAAETKASHVIDLEDFLPNAGPC